MDWSATSKWAAANHRAVSVSALALFASLASGSPAPASACHTLLNTGVLTVESGGSCSRSGGLRTFLETGTGTTVKGTVGGRDGIPIADFTSSSLLHANSGSGIEASGTNAYHDLTISLEPNGNSGFTFGALAFREKMPNGPQSLTIKAFNGASELGEVTLTKAEVKHLLHSNFLVLSSDPITSVVLESSGFIRTSGFRFADVVDPPITSTPIPTALPLLAAGLGALGVLGWRRKRKLPPPLK